MSVAPALKTKLNKSGKPKARGMARVVPERDALLLPYQAKWVKDKSRLKLMEKSRQIGMSWADACRYVREKSLKGTRYDAWISSRDDTQAMLYLEDAKAFARIYDIAAEDLGEIVLDKEKGHTSHTVRLANGIRINSMSSNPDAQAGKRGDRTLDEFALHPDPHKLYKIAYPGLMWGGSLSIFSSHRGTLNYFNQLLLEAKHKGNPKKWSLHRVTLTNALEQGFLYKLQQKLPLDDERQEMDEAAFFDYMRSGAPDEESFLEEFECEPSDDESAFVSYPLIQGCIYLPGFRWALDDLRLAKGPLYVGVDIGRKRDLTVIWVFEKLGDTLFTREMIELAKMPFSAQEKELYPILDLPGVRRCCIDNSGIGNQFAERATEKYGTARIESITFTNQAKSDLAYPAKAHLEDRTVRIPDDKFITADFRSIRKDVTAGGNERFRGERTKDGHADRWWAFALACQAAHEPNGGYGDAVLIN